MTIRKPSPSLFWSALVAFACFVGFISVLLVAAAVKLASAEPLVIAGEDALKVCRARCDSGAPVAFVEPDALVALLKQREELREELAETKAKLEVERAKPRCGA